MDCFGSHGERIESLPSFQIELLSYPADTLAIPTGPGRQVEVDMKAHSMLVYLAVFSALACARAGACRAGSTAANSRKAPSMAAAIFAPAPASLRAVGRPADRRLFPVKDDKGLLLSCIAPELGTNSETDKFEDCSLAPGRTLDDVMHSIIKAIHQEQHERVGDDAQTPRGEEERAEPKNAKN
jgi:hypothetical protein